MNVEIGAEAAQFPKKEYINGIFLAVYRYIVCKRGQEFAGNRAGVRNAHKLTDI
jgi:hypothetical protein